jgi:PKD repeat protein
MNKNQWLSFLLFWGAFFGANPSFAQYNAPVKPRSLDPVQNQFFGHPDDDLIAKYGSIPPDGSIIPGFGVKEPFLKTSCQYSSNSQLAGLSTEQLITYLKSTSNYECHARILFNYEAAFSPLIFSNSKIQAVAHEIENLAPGYRGNYSNGIYGLLCYIHVAIYFDFYYSSTISINDKTLEAMQLASDALCANSRLFTVNAEASVVLEEFLINLDYTGIRSRPSSIELVKQVMRNMVFNDTWETASNINWVTGYWRIFFLMYRGASDPDYLNAISHDNEFIQLWGKVATDREIKDNTSINYIFQDNAILELCRVATYPSLSGRVCNILYTVTGTFPRLHKNWVYAVIAINKAGVCEKWDLCADETALKQEVVDYLFPNIYSYDDGKFVLMAKFQRDIADNLYYATRQTQSQLFRLAQTDQPVAGDINTTLTAIVFESKSSYDDYAPLLYGITTNNGGMYLEQPAEFYTWDRPITYSLSLEELFRHEFNHYLQGRFLIPGYWGNAQIYADNRLTWYEEGQAEFLCGSTDFSGINLKKSTINRLVSDYPNWPTLADVLTSNYNQPTAIYYPYGNLLWYNWYKNDFGKIKTFIDLTRSNDITGFDNLVTSLKNSAGEEAQWQGFLTSVYNGTPPGWQPVTDWKNDKNLTASLLSDIQNEFTAITGITNVTVISDATSLIGRFRISGTITGTGQAADNVQAAISVNQALDALMVQLKNHEYLNNFYYTVGYITNVSNPANTPTADYYILGSLRDPAISDTPVADFTVDHQSVMTGNPVTFESNSTGFIKDYSWSFAGGLPVISTSADPVVTYNSEGTYPVSLTVTGRTPPLTSSKTENSYITVFSPSSNSYCTVSNGNSYSWISRVKLKDIDNITTGFPPNGYSNFTSSCVTELVKGSTYPITVDLSYTNSADISIAVWIDLNQNGSFADPDEQVLLGHPPILSQLSGATITIPANALNGTTRMRVRSSYRSGVNAPCGDDSFLGESEDYSVVIMNSGVDILSPSVPDGLFASYITQTCFVLKWNKSIDDTGVAGYDILLNGIDFGSVEMTTFNVTGLRADTRYSVTVIAKDSAGNRSAPSQPLPVYTLAEQILKVSANALTLSRAADTTKFEITSNISWTIECDQNWLTIMTYSGLGNDTITITVSENPDAAPRTAHVTVSGTDVETQIISIIQESGTIGISQKYNGNLILVFPNPNNGQFNLELDNDLSGEIAIRIYSSDGCYSQILTLMKFKGQTTRIINLNNHAKGVYFVQLITKEQTVVKRVVVR